MLQLVVRLKDRRELSMTNAMRFAALALATLGLMPGCDVESRDSALDEVVPTAAAASDVSFRCAALDVPALGGLDSVLLSGGSAVSGRNGAFDIFSNGDMFLTGGVSVSGGLYSALGDIYVDDDVRVLGGIVEGGLEIPVSVPTDDAAYIEYYRHNSYIGWTNNGRNPVSGSAFNVYGSDYLRLPDYYYYFDSFSISGDSTVSIRYSVTYIFVDGPVEISGGATLGYSSARHVLLVSMSDEPIVISGDSEVIARIYAPLADVEINGGAHVEGAIVAKSINMSGAATMEVTQDGLHIFYPC